MSELSRAKHLGTLGEIEALFVSRWRTTRDVPHSTLDVIARWDEARAALAGVSEARPAEPPQDSDSLELAVREMLVALRMQLPELVWDDVYERTNALSVDRGRLREQLDAARQALARIADGPGTNSEHRERARAALGVVGDGQQ